MTRNRIRLAGLAVVLAGGVLAVACGTEHAVPPEAQAQPALAVETRPVAKGDVSDPLEAGGTVQSRKVAALSARVMAQVREVRVRPGDRVKAGQVLVVLESADLSAQARSAGAAAQAAGQGVAAAEAERGAAEAGLALATATHGRIAALEAKRSATRQELDEAVAALRAAEGRAAGATARVAQAKQGAVSADAASEASRLVEGYASVTAPFDGVVTEKLTEPGNMAAPGVPLLRIEDTAGFRLEVRLDESHIGRVAPGTLVDVTVEALGAAGTLTGTVDEVSRAVDVDARTFLVKVTLPAAAGLRSGLFGRMRVAGPSQSGLLVPEGAVVKRGQMSSVFVVEGGVARVRLVELHGKEVLAGLVEGERVVVVPPPALTDGRKVTEGGRR
ncbi:MAG: efflux RND transporter periplasmic adaptor subunit [Vicinamibacterales bacterium]